MCHSGSLTDTNLQVQNYCAAEQALSKKTLSLPVPSPRGMQLTDSTHNVNF